MQEMRQGDELYKIQAILKGQQLSEKEECWLFG